MKLGTREEYNKKWADFLFGKEDCPLCEEKEGGEMLIWQWKHWFITYNKYPYTWTKFHLMAMPNRHICFAHELNQDEISWLYEVHQFIKDYFWNKQYFSFTRETLANRSVEHLHMQFTEWKLQWKYLRKMFQDQWFPIVQEL